jgi:ABC-type arginine transport system ATPase subunit
MSGPPPSITSLHPLNIKGVSRARDSVGLAISLAFSSLVLSNSTNALSPRMSVSLVYMATILNRPSLSRVISKHGSKVKVSMESLSLW